MAHNPEPSWFLCRLGVRDLHNYYTIYVQGIGIEPCPRRPTVYKQVRGEGKWVAE